MEQRNGVRTQRFRALTFAGGFQQFEALASNFVQHDREVQFATELTEPLPQQVDRIVARVRDLPPRECNLVFLRNPEYAGVVEPLRDRLLGLCREVDKYMVFGPFESMLDNRAETVVAVERGWRREIGAVAQ